MEKEEARGLKPLLKDEDRHKAAVELQAELSLKLTDEQRDQLLRFVESKNRFPTAIEINLEQQIQGQVRRSTLFPVTVLVGAMT